MREIKFRAWDGEKMLTDIAIIEGKVVPRGYVATWWANTLENAMQYTGLKDKNGKEIFEGDILQVTHPINNLFDGIFEVRIHETSMNYVVGEFNLGAGAYRFGEVIGNIYENPELLEEAK